MSRAERNEEVERLRSEMGAVRHAVLIDYRGITVPQVTELRNQIRKGGGRYAVIKNTLFLRAIAGAPLAALKEHLRGPTAIAWSKGEPVALAKTLTAFQKGAPVLQIKAVLIDGQPLDGGLIQQVASLPSREELRGRIAVLLASPLRRLATALAAPARGLATVLVQKAEKSKSEGQEPR